MWVRRSIGRPKHDSTRSAPISIIIRIVVPSVAHPRACDVVNIKSYYVAKELNGRPKTMGTLPPKGSLYIKHPSGLGFKKRRSLACLAEEKTDSLPPRTVGIWFSVKGSTGVATQLRQRSNLSVLQVLRVLLAL